jgi:aryl-alcohol dehydrogenase-like predicted oxidoreductase
MNDGQEASDKYVSWAIDRGVNYFDVAPIYGDAQEKLGNSLKEYRKNIFLACKTTQRLRTQAEKDFEQSFELLQTDYFDIYQMHMLSNQQDIDEAFGPDGVIEMMIKAKQKGRVRKLGITAHTESIAIKAMALYDFDTVLFPINWMLNMRDDIGTQLCEEARKRGMGILSMKSFIHRRWKDRQEHNDSKYGKSWCKPIDTENRAFGIAAIKYAFQMGPDVIVPPGNFKSFSFAVENIEEILSSPLSQEERRLLDKEFALVKDYPFFDKNGQMAMMM